MKLFRFLRTMIFSTLNSIIKIFLEIFVFDKQIRRILKGKVVKFYIKKYAKKARKKYLQITTQKNNEKENELIIWQFWEQGFDNAPEIVKSCTKSVEKFANGAKVIRLDYESIKKYVEIPQYIYKLKEKGIIKSALFSDILRTYLLSSHGGIWVDATVLFTDNLPDYIKEADFFVFKNHLRVDLDGLNFASYFIKSKPNHPFVEQLKIFIDEYFKENLFVVNYFLYLHGFALINQISKESRKMFDEIPFFSFVPVQQFQKELMNPYSKKRFDEIKKTTPIHKLSHKINVFNKNKKDIQGTFYDKLVNGELE